VTTIGFYEARTHLSELLDQIAKGKKVLITRRGQPAAVMGPPPKEEEQNVSQVVKEMLAFRDDEGPTLGRKATIRQLIEEGRRF
jgi:antitoxin (DNA-binding transcriptional repressor) of toxin-antitoxin stability system